MRKLTKEDYIYIDKIVERAMSMGFYEDNKITAFMDIENATRHWNMQLSDWLNADDFHFAHDVTGIYNHIIRETPVRFNDMFLPRFAGIKED